MSDRNLATDDEVRVCLLPWQLYVMSHCRTTDNTFDVTIGQCVVSDRNTATDGEVRVSPLP